MLSRSTLKSLRQPAMTAAFPTPHAVQSGCDPRFHRGDVGRPLFDHLVGAQQN
jgi:hypothetical protein